MKTDLLLDRNPLTLKTQILIDTLPVKVDLLLLHWISKQWKHKQFLKTCVIARTFFWGKGQVLDFIFLAKSTMYPIYIA